MPLIQLKFILNSIFRLERSPESKEPVAYFPSFGWDLRAVQSRVLSCLAWTGFPFQDDAGSSDAWWNEQQRWMWCIPPIWSCPWRSTVSLYSRWYVLQDARWVSVRLEWLWPPKSEGRARRSWNSTPAATCFGLLPLLCFNRYSPHPAAAATWATSRTRCPARQQSGTITLQRKERWLENQRWPLPLLPPVSVSPVCPPSTRTKSSIRAAEAFQIQKCSHTEFCRRECAFLNYTIY